MKHCSSAGPLEVALCHPLHPRYCFKGCSPHFQAKISETFFLSTVFACRKIYISSKKFERILLIPKHRTSYDPLGDKRVILEKNLLNLSIYNLFAGGYDLFSRPEFIACMSTSRFHIDAMIDFIDSGIESCSKHFAFLEIFFFNFYISRTRIRSVHEHT